MNNVIGLWANLARAYEVAKLGNFSIKLVSNMYYTQAFEDYKIIKEFYNDVEFSDNGTLIVEIYKPDYVRVNELEVTSGFESKDNILKRVKMANSYTKPELVYDNASQNLLKSAVSKLKLSGVTIMQLAFIASTIAQLDKSAKIKCEHLAEAIHYKYNMNETLVSLENHSVSFGSGIKVSLGTIDNEDIENAIKYLKSLQG